MKKRTIGFISTLFALVVSACTTVHEATSSNNAQGGNSSSLADTSSLNADTSSQHTMGGKTGTGSSTSYAPHSISGNSSISGTGIKKQTTITSTQAKKVANDIENKQTHSLNPSAHNLARRELPRETRTYTPESSYNWSYNDSGDYDYWSQYNIDERDYETDWYYTRDADYSSWAYDENEDYDTWLSERASTKTVTVPRKATLRIYSMYNGALSDMVIAYDIDNKYIREEVTYNDPSSSSNMDFTAYCYVKNNQLHVKTVGTEYDMDESFALDSETGQLDFEQIQEGVEEYFIQNSMGQNYLSYIDLAETVGWESEYQSDDAGNLVMRIKGSETVENVTYQCDISATWDEYYLRSTDIHASYSGYEAHVLYSYSDNVEYIIPGGTQKADTPANPEPSSGSQQQNNTPVSAHDYLNNDANFTNPVWYAPDGDYSSREFTQQEFLAFYDAYYPYYLGNNTYDMDYTRVEIECSDWGAGLDTAGISDYYVGTLNNHVWSVSPNDGYFEPGYMYTSRGMFLQAYNEQDVAYALYVHTSSEEYISFSYYNYSDSNYNHDYIWTEYFGLDMIRTDILHFTKESETVYGCDAGFFFSYE